jgi:ADP-heptose:LPS heptosyltransferase
MLQNIGINYELTKENARYGLNVPDSVCTDIESLLTSVGLGGGQEYCIIHPGSGGSAVDLPESSFIELIGLIYEQTQLRVVLTGSQGEYELCERVGGGKAINLAGKLTLLQLLGIIEKSFIFVSNSTGPLHIAAALHKPVIGFFPKVRVCSAERWGPYAMNVYVFKPSISCSNCTVAQCQKLDCMRTIDVNQVLQRIITFSEMV